MDFWVCEVCLFKYGFGIGINFFGLCGEGEVLFGGGKFLGLMGFLKIGDCVVGVIKFGGIICCVVKMVICDVDYLDVEEFINWKVKEEQKVVFIVVGFKMYEVKLNDIFVVICGWDGSIEDVVDLKKNDQLKFVICGVKKVVILEVYVKCVLDYVCQGYESIEFLIYNIDWDFEVYVFVLGQNFNNLICVIDSFLRVVCEDKDWELICCIDGMVVKIIKVCDLWE